jgi:hypothetical protein
MLSAEFQLSRLFFEARFDQAYTFWDNAGAIAQRIMRLRPGLHNVKAQPSEIEFRSETNSLRCGMGSVHVGAKKLATVADVEEQGKLAAEFLAAVNETLRVTQYLRVGCRLVFVRTFQTADEASRFFQGTGLLQLPHSLKEHLADADRITEPSVSFRMENGQIGALFRLQVTSQTVELLPDFDLADEVPPFEKLFHRFVMDADHYTVGPLAAGKLDPAEWIKASFRAITRDGQRLLGEKV